jgi:membrane-associated phospholipid phosphatase
MPGGVSSDRRPWVAGQLLLAAVLVFVYFRVRGLTEGSPARAHDNAAEVIGLERSWGIDVEGWIEHGLLKVPFATTLANWVYIWGHWPVIIATMVWLARRSPSVFRQLRDGMMISGGVGMAVFALYPLAPPRLVDQDLPALLAQQSVAYRILQPPAFTNQYAAMPSLHAGWDLLVGIALVAAASGVLLRAVGLVLPVLMAVAVMATANHYVLDVVVGLTVAAAAHTLAAGLERRRSVDPGRPSG